MPESENAPDWFAPQKPQHCPQCGLSKFVPILYGYPGNEAREAAQRGELVLGGCSVVIDPPLWYCRGCGLKWR